MRRPYRSGVDWCAAQLLASDDGNVAAFATTIDTLTAARRPWLVRA